jgi:hypothetical protein
VQGDPSPRRGARHLLESKAQAASGLSRNRVRRLFEWHALQV